jgi:putative phage-type endonuclease
MMAIVKGLEQGSPEWHKYRSDHVMGTDIPIILGSNPWKTKLELWEEKLGMRPPQEINDAMRRGQELEPIARKLASELIGVEFEPVVYESFLYPWLAASLDGYIYPENTDGYILEIKCPKESTHLEAINGFIPEYYADQIQTQLLVTQAEMSYYFSYRPEYIEKPYSIIEVYPNFEKHIEILAKSKEFYMNMCNMNPPHDWKLKERK